MSVIRHLRTYLYIHMRSGTGLYDTLTMKLRYFLEFEELYWELSTYHWNIHKMFLEFSSK